MFKNILHLSKNDLTDIGKKSGWIKTAQSVEELQQIFPNTDPKILDHYVRQNQLVYGPKDINFPANAIYTRDDDGGLSYYVNTPDGMTRTIGVGPGPNHPEERKAIEYLISQKYSLPIEPIEEYVQELTPEDQQEQEQEQQAQQLREKVEELQQRYGQIIDDIEQFAKDINFDWNYLNHGWTYDELLETIDRLY